MLVFYVLTIQSPSSGCSSCLFLCVIRGSNGSQVLQTKWNHTNITGISDMLPINGPYLIQKAKLGVLLLWVFTSRIRPFFHQKNITLFTLEPEKKQINIKFIYQIHTSREPGNYLSAPEYYHCFYNVVGPSDLPRPLTSCHTLPVLVDEWYDVLQREIKDTCAERTSCSKCDSLSLLCMCGFKGYKIEYVLIYTARAKILRLFEYTYSAIPTYLPKFGLFL